MITWAFLKKNALYDILNGGDTIDVTNSLLHCYCSMPLSNWTRVLGIHTLISAVPNIELDIRYRVGRLKNTVLVEFLTGYLTDAMAYEEPYQLGLYRISNRAVKRDPKAIERKWITAVKTFKVVSPNVYKVEDVDIFSKNIPTFTGNLYINPDKYPRRLDGPQIIPADERYANELQHKQGMNGCYSFMTFGEAYRVCNANTLKVLADKLGRDDFLSGSVRDLVVGDALDFHGILRVGD